VAPPPTPADGYTLELVDSATFAAADYRPTWLIRRVLVKGQPALWGGPYKSLKTSIAVDAAVSLGSGTPFLNHFAVPARVRTVLLSGEAGGFALQDTARRVCAARGLDLVDDQF